jgi:hypothetical protein
MAKYISFNVSDGAGSGLAGASAFQDGINLVPVDLISGVFQASATTATIQLNSVGAADIITVSWYSCNRRGWSTNNSKRTSFKASYSICYES